MSLVCINNSSETFTPTVSGAVATHIWESCRAAARAGTAPGALPWVISRAAGAAPYDYPHALFVPYPRLSGGCLGNALWRLERKLNGWRDLRQKTYARRIVQTLRTRNLATSTLVLHNDPEMAVHLRQAFPGATIVHLFHNQLKIKDRYRGLFAQARIAVAAVSRFTARWIEDYYGLPAGSAGIVYGGVDAERFRPAPDPTTERCVLNFLGRTGREKAPDIFLSAALALTAHTRAFEVQIIGSNHWGQRELDDYQRLLDGLVTQLRAAGITVRCLGHVERTGVPAALQAAHIHVVPSRWDEPFGLTTLEGMASGLATVASNTGGSPEIIADSGLLFARDSADDLTRQLRLLVTDHATRQHYALLARRRAEFFSWDKTWASLNTVAAN